MVNPTMITVNLDLLEITLAVLVCALAIALRVLWESRRMHKTTLRELHEVLDERDLLRHFYDAVRRAPVSTGTCWCGESMTKHSEGSYHVPEDRWQDFLARWQDRLDR